MSLITTIQHLIDKFGDWVSTLFSNASKLYNTLTDKEKQAAEWGYGVIAIINANLADLSPVIDLIKTKYPELSLDVLHGFLDTLIADAHIVVSSTPVTLEDAIKAIASHLGMLKGEFWQAVSQNLGNLLAMLFSPGTPVQKFIGVAEYVYRIVVKPHVESK